MAEVIPLQRPEPDGQETGIAVWRKVVANYGPGIMGALSLAIVDRLPVDNRRRLAGLLLREPRDLKPIAEYGRREAAKAFIDDAFIYGPELAEMNAYWIVKALPEADRNKVLLEMLERWCAVSPAAASL